MSKTISSDELPRKAERLLQAQQAEEVIGVAVTGEGDALRLSGPAGVIMCGNEIIVNGKRIVVK